jgi:hypothetical protein
VRAEDSGFCPLMQRRKVKVEALNQKLSILPQATGMARLSQN